MREREPRLPQEDVLGHRALGFLLVAITAVFVVSLTLMLGLSLSGIPPAPVWSTQSAAPGAAEGSPAAVAPPASAVPHAAAPPAATAVEGGAAEPQPAPSCPPGQRPAFEGRFAELHARLGAAMGEPLECAHPGPRTGDLLQRTTRGLAVEHRASGTARFTDGWRHRALGPRGLVAWEGPSPDPPAERPTNVAPRESTGSGAQRPRMDREQVAPTAPAERAEAAPRSGREEAGARVYVVRPGEQLKHIAARFGVGLWELAGANGLADPDRLRAGQELVIPTSEGQPGSHPQTE